MKKEQRILSRRVIGSRNWWKQKKKVARTHEKMANAREDFLQKITTMLVHENQVISMEDIRVKNLLKNGNLAKAISDVSWAEFRRILTYKCEWYGKELVVVGSNYASSQLCSQCGFKNKKTKNLAIREWQCPSCQTKHDRDQNAAKNILAEGLYDIGKLAANRTCERRFYLTSFGVGILLLQLWEQSMNYDVRFIWLNGKLEFRDKIRRRNK